MRLSEEFSSALNTVTGYGAGYVEVNFKRHTGSVLLFPEGPVQRWPVTSFDALTPELFEQVLDAAPQAGGRDVEVVIFGSGAQLRFPRPQLIGALSMRRIGIETMDFGAACRTYNILIGEGRKVAAALLIETIA